ncbi:hypothetical protein COS75_00465, partial [Candidatus Pacearchaeota archaeon CG06_land_8_20_14_3_00_35_12]
MKYLELKKLLENFPKYPGVKARDKVSVVNDGFPGTFNLSIAEGPWWEEFKSLLNLKPWAYSYIQQVIRPADFDIILENPKEKGRLGLFNLGDIAGFVVKDNKEWKKLWEYMIKALWKFLIDEIGLKKENLRIYCFEGGKVKDVSQGKYVFDKEVEEDPMQDVW